jgi:adenylosuccinate lyase
MRAIALSKMENDLQETEREIKKHEGIINSTKITNHRRKDKSRQKLKKLIKRRQHLSSKITEAMLLGSEIK